MMKVVFRNGSLWAGHTVLLPAGFSPTRTAIQWREINPVAGPIIQRGRLDDPLGQTFYDYPSLAVNRNNDMLIGYSCFSSAQYASAMYSFRAAGDAPNTLRDDVVLKAGEAPYFKTFRGADRFGVKG